ncbi:MAG: CPBP family intramembrane glutamic endopeptidase [Actinomycetota bacterium]
MRFALALSMIVVAYNNVVNRWEPFHGWAYVPLNLAVAGIVTAVAAATLDLSKAELGLEGDVTDLFIPIAFLAVFAVVVFAIASSRRARLIADRRVEGMHGRSFVYYVLVRIPLGTAAPEELVFRGVLYPVWIDVGHSSFGAALFASIAFGLWHISPTIKGVRINDPAASSRKARRAVIGAVVFTTMAGISLTWLRLETGGLLAPVVLHAGINSVGALAAVRAVSRLPARPA